MSLQTENTQGRRTNVFDEDGQTVEQINPPVEETEQQAEPAAEGDSDPAEEPAPKSGQYRVGDRTFDSQEEALAHAKAEIAARENERQIADAYRQGMKEALVSNPQAQGSVTPGPVVTEPEFNTEELYTDPNGFLKKFASKVQTETLAKVEQKDSLKAQSDSIWREFTDAHPALADYRVEVEDFVQKNMTEVRALIATKDRKASYDWIARELKSRFERYAAALKPQRALPNATAGTSPSARASGVTPKTETKKPLSFSDQLRSIRKRR
jgi:hypothetical protein